MSLVRTTIALVCVAFFVPLLLWAASGPLNPEFERLETMYQLPKGILAKTCHVESGCQNKSNGNAVGMFQFMPQTFDTMVRKVYKRAACMARNGCSGGDERLDPVLSAQMTAVMYADSRAQVGGLIQQAGMDMIPGLYLTHFLGVAGAKKFFQGFIQNRNAPAAPAFGNGGRNTASGENRAIFYKSSRNGCVNTECTYAEIYNFTARRMGAAPVATNATADVTDPSGISRVISGYTPPNYFAPTTMPQLPADPARTFMAADSGTLGTSSTQQNNSGSTNTNTTSTAGDVVTTESAFNIIAQPGTVKTGRTIIVSWTSVGMQAASCRATAGGSEIATGNEATKSIPATSTGTVEIILSCKDHTGASVEKRASVRVQE